MSIRVVTATPPARLQNKTKGIVAIVLLTAAALAATIADAAASSRYRHSGVSMPKRSWAGHYAPSDYGRYDHGVSAQSGASSETGRGVFSDANFAP